MTNTSPQAKALGIAAIKTEIARRNPIDDKAVEDSIAHRLRIDELGVPYVVDRSGVREDMNTVEQFLDGLVRARPDFWKDTRLSQPTGGNGYSKLKNPFDKSQKHYNLTAAMELYRTDPETARELAFQAGYKL
ncbi:hypothetical protein [Methylobacterium sp. WL19]|uniref:hypothetical protein n=1 Tax=Methylobacterium sp. WL19 TaxID=2603896 RepID=UPI0011CB456C|nr:hypothetical protein [Methylobacterium sp. WL19]TXN27396.1 hypothetical protein FV220_11580 [Methylobacterium sp. WL19]